MTGYLIIGNFGNLISFLEGGTFPAIPVLAGQDLRDGARRTLRLIVRANSLMRHFLAVALAPAGLPPGMMQAARNVC